MDYIKFVIDELERKDEKRGITVGMARQQYKELLSRLAELEAQQSLAPEGLTDFEVSGKCSNCGNEISIAVSSSNRQ